MLRQSFQQLNPGLARKTPDGNFFNLDFNRPRIFRVAMTKRVDPDAPDNVDQRIAVDVGHGASLGFLDRDSGQQSKILQSRSQVFVFALSKLSALRSWDGRLDGRLLVRGLLNRLFHQAYVRLPKTKRRWSGKLNKTPTKEAVIAREIA